MYEKKFKFSRGEVTPTLAYRVDTEIPDKGLSYLKNAMATTSAGLTNFPKLKKIGTVDLAGATAFRIFKYKINKKDTSLEGYLFLYTDKKVVILRMDNFQYVNELPTGYTPEEVENLSIAQFENSVISCVANKEPVMVRVDESEGTFTVVEYWKNIKNPPVKRVESEYVYSGEDWQVFLWYKSGSKVIFEDSLSEPIFKKEFLENLQNGSVSIYGGDFRIEKIENLEGKQKITTTQTTAPGDAIEIPESGAEEKDKKINVLDLVFSESLFRKGYPAVVTEYNGRVIFGNVGGNPSAIAASRIFDSLNFRQSTEDNDGFVTFIAGNELNTVKDFISYKSLIAVTDKGIFSTQLNTELTTSQSAFYDQKLPRPKGLGYWVESDDAIYYVDSSDRIYRLQDVGADSAYKSTEVSAYSSHFLQGISDIYYFKYGKNNIIAVDQNGEEGRALSYNLSEDILCWSRINKIPGINEYINIDDNIYIFNANENDISIYTYSEDEFEPIKLKLPETTLSQQVNIDVPEFFKRIRFGNVLLLCMGEYDLKVNGKPGIDILGGSGEDTIHKLKFYNVGKNYLNIEQMNNKRIEIIGVFADVVDFEQGEDE